MYIFQNHNSEFIICTYRKMLHDTCFNDINNSTYSVYLDLHCITFSWTLEFQPFTKFITWLVISSFRLSLWLLE